MLALHAQIHNTANVWLGACRWSSLHLWCKRIKEKRQNCAASPLVKKWNSLKDSSRCKLNQLYCFGWESVRECKQTRRRLWNKQYIDSVYHLHQSRAKCSDPFVEGHVLFPMQDGLLQRWQAAFWQLQHVPENKKFSSQAVRSIETAATRWRLTEISLLHYTLHLQRCCQWWWLAQGGIIKRMKV